MSSLHESVSRRRAAAPADLACVTLQPASPALIVCQWQGPSWVFPWSHFSAARLMAGEEANQLELIFTHGRVVLTGSNLHPLIDDLAALRVSTLRDLPANYCPPAGDASPLISRIEVHPVGQ